MDAVVSDENILEVRGLSAWYGKRQVLRDVDLDASIGRVTAIIGPSGCGKSTLLSCLNRTLELVPKFSVERNITYALRYRGIRKRSELSRIVREQLSVVGLLDELEGDVSRSALELSGGQQQRLCIARALATNPAVLLLDEPCSALDVASSAQVEEVLTRVSAQTAVVVVTHNLAQARRIADSVVCLQQGEVAWCGSARDLFESHRESVLGPLYGGELL